MTGEMDNSGHEMAYHAPTSFNLQGQTQGRSLTRGSKNRRFNQGSAATGPGDFKLGAACLENSNVTSRARLSLSDSFVCAQPTRIAQLTLLSAS